MSIPVTDPRHPAYLDHKPLEKGERGRFADRHARNPRICPDCGLLERHRIAGCPSAPEPAAGSTAATTVGE